MWWQEPARDAPDEVLEWWLIRSAAQHRYSHSDGAAVDDNSALYVVVAADDIEAARVAGAADVTDGLRIPLELRRPRW